jgi:hypothetical protein
MLTTAPTTIVPGRVLDILDLKLYQWPGHGVSREREYQYVEDEYMKAEEYQDLIDDPTAFFINVPIFPESSAHEALHDLSPSSSGQRDPAGAAAWPCLSERRT